MYLICHVTSNDHLIETSLRIYEWEPLVLCHYADKSCDHKHCDGRDNVFNLSRASREHLIKGLCEFMDRSPSR